ncbi:hypothetical protein [Streptomyces narbonensis]
MPRHRTGGARERSRWRGPIGTGPAVVLSVLVLAAANLLLHSWTGPLRLVTAVAVSVLLLGVLRWAGAPWRTRGWPRGRWPAARGGRWS